MSLKQWLCFLRWPPGHRWSRVIEDEVSFRRCARCGKRNDEKPPPAVPDPEDMIRRYAAGQHF